MPTIILLDVSLSMLRPIGGGAEDGARFAAGDSEKLGPSRKELARAGILSLLEHISTASRLEYVSLVLFSSLYEILVSFTRDIESVKRAMSGIRSYDRTSLEAGFDGAYQAMVEFWHQTNTIPTQIILITDGHFNHNREQKYLEKLTNPKSYIFGSRLHLVTLAPQSEMLSNPTIDAIVKQHPNCTLYSPRGQLTPIASDTLFKEVANNGYTPFEAQLICGHLRNHVQLFPPPKKYVDVGDLKNYKYVISPEIKIFGFLTTVDFGNPPCLSRHLVLPVGSGSGADGSDSSAADKGKEAAFTVLLHGALKVESMVALAQAGPTEFAYLYSWADTKKKSNLTISFFQPGPLAVPWLGKLRNLAPFSSLPEPPVGLDESVNHFPVPAANKKSYAQGSITWLKQTSIQADVLKVMRNAKKLPEKQIPFYKELNRVRKYALTTGFVELLQRLAVMFERESGMFPVGSAPHRQLRHAANSLRSEKALDSTVTLEPYSQYS